jgi:hypothetical protein
MAKDTTEAVRKGVMLPPPSSKQQQKMPRAGEKKASNHQCWTDRIPIEVGQLLSFDVLSIGGKNQLTGTMDPNRARATGFFGSP